jgi:KamA family protein
MVKNERLSLYIESLQTTAHISTIRFHTRLPIVLPARIDNGFLALLTNHTQKTVMVVHANHPHELCSDTAKAFNQLKKIGVTLLNQSVLLSGVNDNVDVLEQLSQKLFKQGVLPYYLHLPDKVAGTAHFDVPFEQAKQLHLALQARISGYLVPKLVREVPGEQHKTWC